LSAEVLLEKVLLLDLRASEPRLAELAQPLERTSVRRWDTRSVVRRMAWE